MRDELRATLHELEIEHGHSSDYEAVWPVCARRHAVMDRARAALLADTPSVEPPAVSHEATSATGQANSGGGRDADTARIAAVLRQLRPAPSGGYGYRALSAQNLAAALYDAGLRPSVEPAGLDVERLMVAIHRSGIAGCPEDCTSALDEYPSGADSDYATFLAREYAALLPTQASDSPEPKETR